MEKGIKIDILNSLIEIQKEFSVNGLSGRFQIRLKKESFDTWLENNFPLLAIKQAALERAEIWFKKQIIEQNEKHNGKKLKRDFCVEDMVEKFDISGRAAKLIWRNHAPEKWKKPGAIPRE